MDEQTLDFGRVSWEEPNPDGTTSIIEEGYYEGERKSIKVTIRQDIDTSKANLLKDLISCLDELKTPTPDLTIIIKKDRFNNPFLIQKSWVKLKEHKKK